MYTLLIWLLPADMCTIEMCIMDDGFLQHDTDRQTRRTNKTDRQTDRDADWLIDQETDTQTDKVDGQGRQTDACTGVSNILYVI